VKLRIESDGTRKNTKLLAEIDGQSVEIENISEITWKFTQDEEFVTATIKVSEVGLMIKKDCSKEVL
jgi:hypothetical protein